MRKLILVAIAAALLAQPARALTTIDLVFIGDPGNAADSAEGSLYGAVPYQYQIGKYEVTNAQYADFLNAVAKTDANSLYNANMDPTNDPRGGIARTGSSGNYTYTATSGREDKPVVFVSWYDTLRFANWLHNGQPTGVQDDTTTEDGAYTFTGATTVGGRKPGATWFLPTEDEWYKAAYYDAVSMSYNAFPFAVGGASATCEGPPGSSGSTNSANCNNAVGNLTNVGAYLNSPSDYGTFDQGGNVFEWYEALIGGSGPRLRGGSWVDSASLLAASIRIDVFPSAEDNFFGFRVASVPEPGTGLLVMGGVLGLAVWRRRRV